MGPKTTKLPKVTKVTPKTGNSSPSKATSSSKNDKLPSISPSKVESSPSQAALSTKDDATSVAAPAGEVEGTKKDAPTDMLAVPSSTDVVVKEIYPDDESLNTFIQSLLFPTLLDESLSDLPLTLLIEECIEEEKVAKKARENGLVTLIYEMYQEKFTIKDGSIDAAIIDEEYCLSDVMPGCKIHLSRVDKKETYEEIEKDNLSVFIKEEPVGIFQDLEVDNSYYVFVVQDDTQLKLDQEMQRRKTEGLVKENPGLIKPDDGRGFESCSCIYGNPCLDEYACKDWGNRYAIATQNGWKGF